MASYPTAEEMPDASEVRLLTNLADSRLGARVLAVSDEWFAKAENLLKSERSIFIPDKYTEFGKWMDGWESRRHNPDHDWCVIRLAHRGNITAFNVDSSHFTGNHAPFVAVDAIDMPTLADDAWKDGACPSGVEWREVLPKVSIRPGYRKEDARNGYEDDAEHFFQVSEDLVGQCFTHIRFRIYPDGGIARLRVLGKVAPDWSLFKKGDEFDHIAVLNGGRSVWCSDMFFSHMSNLLLPGEGRNMGDGWETKRSRVPDHTDSVIILLGRPCAELTKCIVDTTHFKGNFPESFTLEGAHCATEIPSETTQWFSLIERTKLGPNAHHDFPLKRTDEAVTHVRLTIIPDGGVMRLRLFGKFE
mmetsp:Transcript_5011/g.12485  ORF Transcript_5011/g.12485 Transcript_5011/m.12485 type:complete len:359 (+) Transcript_5011:117-1193(+)|eukprot:CAMPEP_0177652102 /NCGR_PEP_ID=MMETSP0447-20121125/12925_1 /TAXON_ID=0 /ORGANISM="Stygamoeba regulata, Strain BSH-02190019" /LENGTH=358 /DNA_ID=CAMNT_0019155273 /DNA_START=108 /DNA_END=1184 /DNA_ORIENTATION=-